MQIICTKSSIEKPHYRANVNMVDTIEFMKKTNKRHMKLAIKHKIKEALRERDNELAKRRERLKIMLSTEELQQEEELANIFRNRVLENAQKRLDWIATAKFERAEAEREFLKLKQIQRDLAKCEEMRVIESKKITQETKKAQLLQIAEKKAIQMKEKEIDKIWFEASKYLEREKEKQQQYENYLRKIIANKTVLVLNDQVQANKQLKEIENKEKKEENVRNERASNDDVLRVAFEERCALSNKRKEGIGQKTHLQRLEEERVRNKQAIQRSEAVVNQFFDIEAQKDIEDARTKKNLDNESYARYLEYVRNQKSEMEYRNKMLDTALMSYDRRNQAQSEPKNKIPYQKSFR